MEVSILHLVESPDRDYRWKDRLNSKEGHLSCLFLEWTGWYSHNIRQRLLGHYRLYQIFKTENGEDDQFPSPLAYIISYKASHWLKYALCSAMAAIYYPFSFGDKFKLLPIAGLNRLLITSQAAILQEFLQDAEENFAAALKKAAEQIAAPGFLQKTEQHVTLIQQNQHYTTVQAASGGAKGKEKGVFSKKQLLIMFDLLAESKPIEKIDYTKPNKFETIATMLQAVSGKSKDSILEQLKDTRSDGELYSFQSMGELNQLIITLSNLADTFRKAGFRSISNLADKKLRHLEQRKNDFLNAADN